MTSEVLLFVAYYTAYRVLAVYGTNPKLASRIISSAVAVVMSVFLVLYLSTVIGSDVWISFQTVISSYMLYDLFAIFAVDEIYSSTDSSIVFHHILTYVAVSIYRYGYFPWWFCLAYMAEFSTPFLNLSWYLVSTHKNRQYRVLFYASNWCVVVMFITFRFINYVYLIYWTLQLEVSSEMITALTVFSLYLILNIRWLVALCRKMVRMIVPS